ncbi:MAG: hypothetical protein COY68_04745 [Candidatus Levybacteria bacterium CG_4_10_14_0_8_um_filter_35_23]|nr:MAG: hypothetical protein COY68_04745 [Candidatus Levybacteria bacterium CG_4_10_14_0_8_um_filter_35_23]
MESFEKNYNRALRFLSFRLRSEKEIRNYFQKHKVELSVAEKIIEKLKKYRFLNDEDFAKLWIESRLKHKLRSISLIRRELLLKGIDKEIIDVQISNFQFSISNELENAQKLIRKRIERYKDLPRQEIYQKLGRFLASKGFNWDTIKKSIDEVLEEKV